MRKALFFVTAAAFLSVISSDVDARSNRHKGEVVVKGRKHWDCHNLRKVYVRAREGQPILVTVEAGVGNARLPIWKTKLQVGQRAKVKFPFMPHRRYRVIVKELGKGDGGGSLVYAHIEKH